MKGCFIKIIFVFFCFMVSVITLHAQSDGRLWSEAEKSLMVHDYQKAMEQENQLYFGSESHGNMDGFDMFEFVYDLLKNKWRSPLHFIFLHH